MLGFEYVRASDVGETVATVSADPAAAYLAGGTTQLDLMLKDGVVDPQRLVDITRLPLRGITRRDDTLQVGALTTMEELAADPVLAERLPSVREALAGCCFAAVAQHGDDRRQLAAAHALPLFPRLDGGGVQQAGTRLGLRGRRRAGKDARDPRRERELHRVARVGPLRAAGRPRSRCPHPRRGRRAERSADRLLCAPGRSSGRRERARAWGADYAGGRAAAGGRCAVGLPEGARPRLVRVRRQLRGGGAAD